MDESGFIGFGITDRKSVVGRSNSVLYQLKEKFAISKEIVSYNITYGKGKDQDFSYVQLGDFSKEVGDLV